MGVRVRRASSCKAAGGDAAGGCVYSPPAPPQSTRRQPTQTAEGHTRTEEKAKHMKRKPDEDKADLTLAIVLGVLLAAAEAYLIWEIVWTATR